MIQHVNLGPGRLEYNECGTLIRIEVSECIVDGGIVLFVREDDKDLRQFCIPLTGLVLHVAA